MASIDEDPSTVLSRLYEQIIADEKRYAEGKTQGPSKEWPKPKSGKPRPRPSIDLVGPTYGRLTVLEVIEDDPPPAQYHLKPKKFRARCACGREVSVWGNNLRSGKTKSCGCLREEVTRHMSKTSSKAPDYPLLRE